MLWSAFVTVPCGGEVIVAGRRQQCTTDQDRRGYDGYGYRESTLSSARKMRRHFGGVGRFIPLKSGWGQMEAAAFDVYRRLHTKTDLFNAALSPKHSEIFPSEGH